MDISKLKTSSAEAIIFGISPVFSMAVLLYVKSPDVFLSMDLLKLLILCVGFSLPLYVLNFVTLDRHSLHFTQKKDHDLELIIKGHTGTFTSFQISFVSMVMIYYPLSIKGIIFLLLSIWMVFRLIAIIDKQKSTQESKPSQNQPE